MQRKSAERICVIDQALGQDGFRKNVSCEIQRDLALLGTSQSQHGASINVNEAVLLGYLITK